MKQFDTGIPRILLLHPASGFHISLYAHDQRSRDRSSPLRTGLDHLALAVTDERQHTTWTTQLDELGIQHSPIRDLGHARFVSLADPDGIQIELWLTITPFRPADDSD